jgi:hypothetical protein
MACFAWLLWDYDSDSFMNFFTLYCINIKPNIKWCITWKCKMPCGKNWIRACSLTDHWIKLQIFRSILGQGLKAKNQIWSTLISVTSLWQEIWKMHVQGLINQRVELWSQCTVDLHNSWQSQTAQESVCLRLILWLPNSLISSLYLCLHSHPLNE